MLVGLSVPTSVLISVISLLATLYFVYTEKKKKTLTNNIYINCQIDRQVTVKARPNPRGKTQISNWEKKSQMC